MSAAGAPAATAPHPPPRATRHVYRDHLAATMVADPGVVCLDGDTGLFAGVDFGTAADRYLNLGIAEQNLIGVAAGLAAGGLLPYVTTMAGFACSRAVEAVKLDIAYNRLPVRIVATHAGVSAGPYGPTHHALEDLAVMRALPHMTVVVPGDPGGLIELLDQLADRPGPAYVRLGRDPNPPLPVAARGPVIGRLQPLRAGRDAVLVATGPLPVLAALGAADLLDPYGVRAAVLHAHTLKPFDAEGLLDHVSGTRLVVTVEEHWPVGGLGSAVAEVLAERAPRRLLRVGMPDEFVHAVGGQEELLERAGVSPAGICGRVLAALAGDPAEPEGDRG